MVHSYSILSGRGLHLSQTNAPSCLASHGDASAAALFQPKGRCLKPVLAGKYCTSSVVINIFLTRRFKLISAFLLLAYSSIQAEETVQEGVKDVAPFHFLYESSQSNLQQLPENAKSIALTSARKLFKRTNAHIAGAFTLIFPNISQVEQEDFKANMGFPIDKKVRKLDRFFYQQTQPYHCRFLIFKGKVSQIKTEWQQFISNTKQQGFHLTGEARALFVKSIDDKTAEVELQLGILP